jgi:selenocysteine-specific elongation factor
MEVLESLGALSLSARLPLAARLSGLRGVTLSDLQAQTGIRAESLLREIVPTPDLLEVAAGAERRWLHREHVAAFRKRAMGFLREYFNTNRLVVALAKSEFLQKTMPPDLDPAVIEFLLADLAKEKIAEVRGDTVDVPGRSRELGGAEGELARLIEKTFRDAGLQTPAVSELIRSIPQKPKVIEGVIAYLVKRGTLLRIAEGVYLHAEVVDDAKKKLEAHRGSTADVGFFKDLFGISRKVVIPLLELFDREGLTKRSGDRREILQPRA